MWARWVAFGLHAPRRRLSVPICKMGVIIALCGAVESIEGCLEAVGRDSVAVTWRHTSGTGQRRSPSPGSTPRPQPLSPLLPLPPLAAPALDSAAPGDLTDALCEFDAVLADFASPFHERHFHYEEHLERMKRRSSASVSDSSGFSDSESECGRSREGARSPGDSGPPPTGGSSGLTGSEGRGPAE